MGQCRDEHHAKQQLSIHTKALKLQGPSRYRIPPKAYLRAMCCPRSSTAASLTDTASSPSAERTEACTSGMPRTRSSAAIAAPKHLIARERSAAALPNTGAASWECGQEHTFCHSLKLIIADTDNCGKQLIATSPLCAQIECDLQLQDNKPLCLWPWRAPGSLMTPSTTAGTAHDPATDATEKPH